MNETLLAYYEAELRYLRETGGEFAASFPKVASRLGLDAFECVDPYVERLLEGFSFLAARVRMELDGQFPRFTQHLAEMMFPGMLAPTPSMAVVQLEPDRSHPSLARGVTVPRGTSLFGRLGPDGTTRCEYRTGHDVTLLPLRLTDIEYRPFDGLPSGVGCGPSHAPKAMLSLRFDWHPGVAPAMRRTDRLSLYLHGGDGLAERIYRQITVQRCGAYLRFGEPHARKYAALPSRCIQARGFEDSDALLPVSNATYRGYRLLREYFAFPERYKFIDLTGLERALGDGREVSFEAVLLFDALDETLLRSLATEHFALHCAPAINLFARRADRIAVDDRRFEQHVVIDRTRPLDFEVFGIEGIDGYSSGRAEPQRFTPFYRACDPGDGERAYFQLRRAPRQLSAREHARGARSRYAGTEVFVALVDSREAPYSADLRQLGVDALCTNRDLPLSMPIGVGTTDFVCGSDLPSIARVRCLSGPSLPKPALAERGALWPLLNTLSGNRLPLVTRARGHAEREPMPDDAQALRQWLTTLCSGGEDDPERHRIALLRHASARPVTRRLPFPGPLCFGRGLEISLTFDDAAWSGARVSLFSAVLAAVLVEYVPINHFAEAIVRTPSHGIVARYRAQAGRCEIL